ncbi:MAG: virulence factor [Marinilabiliales bacterium]|nr:virulence factor [Marinilabiliales bacterium]
MIRFLTNLFFTAVAGSQGLLIRLLILTGLFNPAGAIGQTADGKLYRANHPSESLPLIATGDTDGKQWPFVLYLTGDGGYNDFSASFCKHLNEMGLPVVALDALIYFRQKKGPEETTADVVTILDHYRTVYHRDKFVLAGFSFGAAILPFVRNRLPREWKVRLQSTLMISPDAFSDFEIHWYDRLNLEISKGDWDVIREVKQDPEGGYFLFFGSEEVTKTGKRFTEATIPFETIEGDHHLGGGFDHLMESIRSIVTK